MKVQGKIIIVTGGADGIGAALCRRFAREGAAHIAVVDLNAEGAAKVAAEIGGSSYGVDVSNPSAVEAMVRAVETVNVMAHVYGARAALPGMIARREGYILNTVSAAGLLSQIGSAVYSTTKHAAIGFAESLAIAQGDLGIKVSVLCPQGVDTAMLRAGGGQEQPQNLDGVLSPDEVAEAVVQGLEAESFLILPHEIVRTYMQRKTADYDRWLGGMRRLRAKVLGRA